MKIQIFVVAFQLLTCLTIISNGQNKYEIVDNRLKVAKPITFVGGTDKLEPISDEGLKFVKEYLADKKYISTLRIEVHFHAGTKDAQTLSEKRALAVANWLVKNGVDCKRLIAVGFGSTKPVENPPQALGNDRIEFRNAALGGHAIGGMPLDGGGVSAGSLCESP